MDADPADPVESWPIEGIQAALERGLITDYRRLASAIRRDPWGDVARALEHVLRDSRPYSSAALMQHVIARAREAADAEACSEVAALMRAAVEAPGLTRVAFASRAWAPRHRACRPTCAAGSPRLRQCLSEPNGLRVAEPILGGRYF